MLRGFSPEAGHLLLQHRSASSSRLSLDFPDLPGKPAYTLKPGQPSPGQHSLLRPPFAVTPSTGILTCFPSTTPFGLALGVDSPLPPINVGQEPLVFRRAGFSPALSLLMSAFALLIPPACLTAHLRRLTERSPTQQRISVAAAASVHGLAPLHLPRRPTRPVSYYAFFK